MLYSPLLITGIRGLSPESYLSALHLQARRWWKRLVWHFLKAGRSLPGIPGLTATQMSLLTFWWQNASGIHSLTPKGNYLWASNGVCTHDSTPHLTEDGVGAVGKGVSSTTESRVSLQSTFMGNIWRCLATLNSHLNIKCLWKHICDVKVWMEFNVSWSTSIRGSGTWLQALSVSRKPWPFL